MKSLLNYRRFINRRNFQNEQAPSAEVIYSDAVHTQLVQQIPQETKHRDIISCSTSSNRNQAQKCNRLDVFIDRSESKMNIAHSK